MKVQFSFKGSIFNQKEPIEIELEKQTTLLTALHKVCAIKQHLQPLLFRDEQLRSDVLILVDKTDVIAMGLLDFPLSDNQQITILPLAHGG